MESQKGAETSSLSSSAFIREEEENASKGGYWETEGETGHPDAHPRV